MLITSKAGSQIPKLSQIDKPPGRFILTIPTTGYECIGLHISDVIEVGNEETGN